MKATIKLLTIALCTFTSVMITETVSAQVYERFVEYTVDTIYLKPKSNRIGFNVGTQLDCNGDGTHRNNFGVYAFGRVNLSRFMVSGLIAMPVPGVNYNSPDASSYSVQEFTGVLAFGAFKKKGKKGIVSSEEYGTESTLFYVGAKNKQIVTINATTTYVYPSGFSYATKTSSKGVVKDKVYSDLNVAKRSTTGLSFGVFNWTRPNNISGVARVSGFNFGLVTCINKKAKYRFHYQVKGNTCTPIGDGKYNVVPNGKVYKSGTKTGKTNQTIDFGMEVLYAPTVKFDINQERVFADENDTIGSMQDIKKKNWGFRFRTEVRRGPISMRYEVGLRPGVKYKVGGAAGEDNFATRMMGGAYILMGFGIGIGAW